MLTRTPHALTRAHRTRAALTLAVAAGLALTACSNGATTAASRQVPVAPVVTQGPVVDVPLETAAPTAAPVVTASPTVSPTPRRPAPPSYDVKAVQRQLTQQRYYVGAINGERGGAMRSAVMAFQKVNGLGADGIVGATTLAALKAPRAPQTRGSGSNRIEVDLTKQVAYVVKSGALTRVLPISSGNGATYLQKDGSKARALTPTGYFTVQRRIIGERKADLGSLYDPQYFYRGWAIHGSNSVPPYPASHGCVRVTRTDAKWLLGQISVGTTVYLYGGTHTFTAGSSAPGTDNPTGDTDSEPTTAPSPTTAPTTAAPKPTTSPTPSPTRPPTASPTPSPTSSAPPKPVATATATP